jgi:hypothetical protein
MLKKLSLVVLFLCLVPFADQGIFSIINDISAPLITPSQPGPQKTTQSNPGVYLVTYADGHDVIVRNQQTLAFSALDKGIDFILNYNRSHLDAAFAEKYSKILEQKKGAGYWLWKPWVILKTLKTTPENAIIVYADSGFVFRKSLQPLIELAHAHDMVFIDYDPKEFGCLGRSTKRESFQRLDCDTLLCRQAPAIWAAFMVLRNTPTTRAFVKKWLDYCCDEAILTDTPSTQPEYPEYQYHRHDQSILGMLCYLNPQGQYLYPEKELLYYYAISHRRRPDHAAESLLPYTQSQEFFRKAQNKILNNSLMLWLRKATMT